MISGESVARNTFSRKLFSGRLPLERSDGLLAPTFHVQTTIFVSRNEQYSISRFCISFSKVNPCQQQSTYPTNHPLTFHPKFSRPRLPQQTSPSPLPRATNSSYHSRDA